MKADRRVTKSVLPSRWLSALSDAESAGGSATPASDSESAEPDTADEGLYASLADAATFVDAVDVEQHTRAPGSMLLVQTRVLGVPAAIEAGRYRDVNALGVATIAAVTNAMPEVELPFLFEGDGATLLVPGTRRLALVSATPLRSGAVVMHYRRAAG